MNLNKIQDMDAGRVPIFIVGAPRSGTTLMARILNRHREIYAPGESHFFEDIWTRRNEIGELSDHAALSTAVKRIMTLFGRFDFAETQNFVSSNINELELIDETMALGESYGALYYAFMNRLTELKGKYKFCDDTPKHIYYLDTILDFFPNAKIIGFVRDPRDYLNSYKNYWKTTSDKESKRVKSLYHPIVSSMLWGRSTDLTLKYANQLDSDRYLLMRYEELVKNPVEEVKKACDFLLINYSDRLLLINVHNSSFKISDSGIYTSSIGRWRKNLDTCELWWVQTITRKQMDEIGYEYEKSNPSFLQLFISALTAPFALIRALRLNTARRGPIFQYLKYRLIK